MALPLLALSAGASALGSIFSGNSKEKAANRAIQQSKSEREKLIKQAKGGKYQGGYGLSEIFGEKVDIPLYQPIDITASQLATIAGNLQAVPGAADLGRKAMEADLAIDLDRARKLIPDYDEIMRTGSRNAAALNRGELPFDDVLGILRETGGRSAQIGQLGGGMQRNATARDFGMSRLQAMEAGQSMFGRMMQLADNSISPVSRNPGVTSSFLTPGQRLRTDVQQQMARHQSEVMRAQAEAMPDPAASNLFGLQFYESGNQPVSGGSWFGDALSMAGAIGGGYATGQYNQRILDSYERGNGGWSQPPPTDLGFGTAYDDPIPDPYDSPYSGKLPTLNDMVTFRRNPTFNSFLHPTPVYA